jgi:hypothetical protein
LTDENLTVLLESKLISVRQAGTRRLYQANRDALAHLCAQLGVFWDERIGRLKAAAEKAETQKTKKP